MTPYKMTKFTLSKCFSFSKSGSTSKSSTLSAKPLRVIEAWQLPKKARACQPLRSFVFSEPAQQCLNLYHSQLQGQLYPPKIYIFQAMAERPLGHSILAIPNDHATIVVIAHVPHIVRNSALMHLPIHLSTKISCFRKMPSDSNI